MRVPASPPPTTSPPELAHLWYEVHKEVDELMRHTFPGYQHRIAWVVLRFIQRSPGITVSDLARRMGVAKSHVSKVVERLVAEDLVEKRSDRTDRRLQRLLISPRAAEWLARLSEQAGKSWRRVLAHIPPDEWLDVFRALHLLRSALEKTNQTWGAKRE